jgi:hypothetical protein
MKRMFKVEKVAIPPSSFASFAPSAVNPGDASARIAFEVDENVQGLSAEC